MINKILNITQIIRNLENQKHYNNTIPLLLQIIDKTKDGYKIKLGNNVIEAQSANQLQIGGKYWAIINENKNGEIVISNLINRPKIFEAIKDSSLKFDINELKEALKDTKFIQKFSENLEQKIINSSSKDDFLFLTNSLIALNRKIINLVVKDNKKDMLLQIKIGKKEEIEFSAIFNNLGIINGNIYSYEALIIKVQFQYVKKILESNVNKLEDYKKFNEIKILKNENIDILFNICDNNILDLEI